MTYNHYKERLDPGLTYIDQSDTRKVRTAACIRSICPGVNPVLQESSV